MVKITGMFELHVLIPTRLLTPLIGLLNEDDDVEIIKLETHVAAANRHHTEHGRFRMSGTTGIDVILDELTKYPGMTDAQLRQAFEKLGRSPTSVGSALSQLHKKNKIAQNGKGGWIKL